MGGTLAKAFGSGRASWCRGATAGVVTLSLGRWACPGSTETGDRVYVSVTTTKGLPGQPELGPVVAEQMLAWLRGIDGFEGLLMLDDDGSGTTLTLTFWRDRDVADRHWATRMQFRDRVTAAVNVNVEETVDYDVSFVQLGPAWRK
jgi:heme-degrading monooxygenase HmoA